MGITVWHSSHLSVRVDPGVLLQHAWIWFFSTFLFYSCSRYAHCGYTIACYECASCSEGRAPWLPRLWAFEDCVQRWDDFRLLWASCRLGDRQFTPCKAFTKGPRFMNMVMTFVLHPLSHYNSITEPRARFLLALLEHLTIDFPSHFILSILYVYRDTATCDKLIFPLTIMRILCHFSVPFPSSNHFSVMCVIDYATIKCSEV